MMGYKKTRVTSCLGDNALLVSTILGVGVGVLVGFSLRDSNLSSSWLQIIEYPGELFTRALECLILPLIVSSLIVGSASLDAKVNGKIALRTCIYFISTSFFNAILGILLVTLIHPGDPSIKSGMLSHRGDLEERKNTLLDNFLDLGRNVVPSNIFTATFQQTQTVYEAVDSSDPSSFARKIVLRGGTNTLGIIAFALAFGCILGSLEDERGKQTVLGAFRVVDTIIMTIVRGIMFLTPIGVASLIGGKLLSVANVGEVVTQLGLYIGTVFSGVLLYQLIIMQVIYFLVKRRNPFAFYWGCITATVTAFTTASAAVAMPVSFRCLSNLGVDSRVANFVLPIGVTVNKDGTAMFVSIASIFIAQMNGVSLGLGDLVTVAVTSTAVSIASASVPSAALALMFIVLNAIGVPTSDIGLLFAVDWLVDRIRTTNNCLGDLYATAIVEHFSQKELAQMQDSSTPSQGKMMGIGIGSNASTLTNTSSSEEETLTPSIVVITHPKK